MKNYKELAQSVLDRRDKYFADRKRKKKKRIKRACAICGVFVLLLGISAVGLEWFGIRELIRGQKDTNVHSSYQGPQGSYSSDQVEIITFETTTAPTTSAQITTNPTTSGTTTTPVLAPDFSTLGRLYGGTKIFDYEFSKGEFVSDWTSDGDVVYMLIGKTNRCISVDTNTGKVLREISLTKKAVEIRIFDNELWISIPAWKSIMIYDKDTFALLRQMKFQTEVGSFDMGERYLVYTDSEQGLNLYRYDLLTGECEQARFFGCYKPEIVLDEKNGVVYVGDSGSTGSKVYCLGLNTLGLQSRYIKNNYGYCNTKRKMFLTGDGLYWGVYKLDPNDVSKVLMIFDDRNQEGMLDRTDRFTVLTNGVYVNDTGKKIIAFDHHYYNWNMVEITASGNAIFAFEDGFYVLNGWSDAMEEMI
ncbi:MAG: hypothetical protein IKU25_00815 [Clostridia bacterium]|nr:hypothetical protein [Clostridia bacterium]